MNVWITDWTKEVYMRIVLMVKNSQWKKNCNNVLFEFSRWQYQKQPLQVKTLLLKISQYSQENICVGVSFYRSKGLQLYKKRLQHRCCLVNTAKFLTAYFEEHLRTGASTYIPKEFKILRFLTLMERTFSVILISKHIFLTV